MPNHPEHLRELFRATLEALGEMLGLLEREAGALSGRDAATLERIALTKHELVPILDRLAAEQRQCLNAAGITDAAEAGGVEAYLARMGVESAPAAELRADWQEIIRLLQACKRQNELNGAYIALLRRHVEHALDILHGPTQAEATYGRDGAKHRGGAYSRRSYSA